MGGNRGTTVGEQRRIAVQYALDIWGAALDSSVEIRVQARFEPLPCTAGSVVLGAAGGLHAVRDFPGAEFNLPLSAPLITGKVVLADDRDGVATDACSPLRNAQAVRGNIAVVDRGDCDFTDKVKNAQDAGAIGVIVANNVANSPPFKMGGENPAITIRSVMVSLADGSRIKTALGSEAVTATLGNDPAVFAGADPSGRALLYTPNPVARGSSIGHWDPVAFPDQIMEPGIPQYLHSVKEPKDLTLALMNTVRINIL